MKISQVCKLMFHYNTHSETLPKNVVPPVEKVSKTVIKRLIFKCSSDVDDINFSYLKEIYDHTKNTAISDQQVASICGIIATNQIIANVCDNVTTPEEFFHQSIFEETKLGLAFNQMITSLINESDSPGYKEPSYFDKIFDKPLPISKSITRPTNNPPAKPTNKPPAKPATVIQSNKPLSGQAALDAIKNKPKDTQDPKPDRKRSKSVKRVRQEKESDEEKLRLAGERGRSERRGSKKNTDTTGYEKVLEAIEKMDKRFDAFENKFNDFDKAKADIKKNAEKIESALADVKLNKDKIANNEARIEIIESGAGVGVAAAHEFSEYFLMIDRVAATRNSVTLASRNLDLLVPVELIQTLERNNKEVQLNDKVNTFEISERKIANFLSTKLQLRIDFIRIAAKPIWRNLKLNIQIQFINPHLARDAIDNRIKLKIDKLNPKNNPSLSRTLVGVHQKCHNLLSELKRDKKIKDVFISKAGYVNFTVVESERDETEIQRTVLDCNEVLYIYKNGQEADPDVIRALIRNEYFITSKLDIVEVPARFRPRDVRREEE